MDNASNEETRLAQCAVRNTEAFLNLYDRYFARVFTYFRYRSSDPAACDDLTAQTFTQALEKIGQYRPERGPFAAWLFGIARNLIRGHFYQQERDGELSAEEWDQVPQDSAPLEETAIQLDEQVRLAAALETLPAQPRDLLGLKFSGQLTNRQIAALTGLSEQNVGVILYRTLRVLRKKLESMEQQID